MTWQNAKLKEVLRAGGIAVIPTDTLYGIVGSALVEDTVFKIYSARKRNEKKPCIILIGDMKELKKFGIKLSAKEKNFLKEHWPGKVSIIFPVKNKNLHFLHRGSNTLAFRLPKSVSLRKFLLEVGPIIAPSANTEGNPPAESISRAKKYFGNLVDYYLDHGKISGRPSRVMRINGEIIRA